MEWIKDEDDFNLIFGLLAMYKCFNNELNKHERILPCNVSCALCGTLIADEGRKMWLAFPSLFNFGGYQKFQPTPLILKWKNYHWHDLFRIDIDGFHS